MDVTGFGGTPQLGTSSKETRLAETLRASLRAEGDLLYMLQRHPSSAAAADDPDAAAAPLFLKFPAPIAAVFAVTSPLQRQQQHTDILWQRQELDAPTAYTLQFIARQRRPTVRVAAAAVDTLFPLAGSAPYCSMWVSSRDIFAFVAFAGPPSPTRSVETSSDLGNGQQ